MTKLIITGANGKMGKVIKSIVENRDDCEIVARSEERRVGKECRL